MAIVDHAGYTYVGASALHIEKNLEPQILMDDVASEDLCRWLEGVAGVEVTYVPLIYKGLQVLQSRGAAGACYGVRPDRLDLLEGNVSVPAVVADGDRAVWRLQDELVMVSVCRGADMIGATDNERKIWQTLETVDLH